MCAILDADSAHEVFSANRSDIVNKFFQWINYESGRLVVSGQLGAELARTPARQWIQQAILSGRIQTVDEGEVTSRTDQLRNSGACTSNDPHVIALAQVSGARLLYSNDHRLRKDFQNTELLSAPPGKIYSTKKSEKWGGGYRKLGRQHRKLLRMNVCGP